MHEARGQEKKHWASALGCGSAMAWHFEMVLTFFKANRVSVASMSKKQHSLIPLIKQLLQSVVLYHGAAGHGLFLGDAWHFPGEHV